jgi:glycosyltransferase involved in cell wall biosynthesis
MKVLHVLSSIGPRRGGPSFVLRNLVTGLAERGIEIHVATTDDNGPDRKLTMPLGAPVVEDGVSFWYFPRQTRFYQCSLPMMKWLWKNVTQYDLVHVHAVFTFASTMAAWAARARGVPYIVRPLGILNQWGLQRRRVGKKLSFWAIERGILEHAALIHYTSEQEHVEAELAGARTPCMIVANPTDLDPADRPRHVGRFRAKHPHLDKRRLVVFLSRIAAKKGLDLLIPAFARVHEKFADAVLVIAGGGDTELVEKVKENTRSAGLTDHVVWAGFLDRDDKADLLADADLFVLPSYSENFGVAVVEALSFQVPVIVSDQVAIHREISQNHAGLVVPCDSSALADALMELLSKPDLRASMAANAATLSRDRFSRGSILDAVITNYRAILGPVLP